MKIIDISMEIKPNMLAYPGNPKPKIVRCARIPKNITNESLITLGSHTGTHIDSPFHIRKTGKTTNKIPLASLYGKCRVLDLTRAGMRISKEQLMKYKIKKGEIILLKTENSRKQYKKFRKSFAHLWHDAAEYLAKKKIKTLGIDYLSVDGFRPSGGLPVHHLLITNNITVFEGLYLKNVKPGTYTFAGLPLKISCDGAPARAFLINE